nr:uncharacterized protein LOC129276251 [Lytechinus pictus]
MAESHTPLDQLLGNTDGDWDEEYVKEQAISLQQAHEAAKSNISSTLQTEKFRHDALPMSDPLKVGTRVLLQKCAFTGRHKLADKFDNNPYVITKVNMSDDVYEIRPLLGGRMMKVNRKLPVKDPRDDGMPCGFEDSSLQHEKCKYPITVQAKDAGNEEELPFIFVWDSTHPGDQSVVQSPDVHACDGPRRSSRINKGIHSNLNHLPRSVLKL